jgi:hypothetical protein
MTQDKSPALEFQESGAEKSQNLRFNPARRMLSVMCELKLAAAEFPLGAKIGVIKYPLTLPRFI